MRKKIGELLVAAGATAETEIDAALALQRADGPRKRLGELLLDAKKISPAALARALAEQCELPFTQLPKISPEAAKLVSSGYQVRNRMVAFRLEAEGKAQRLLLAVDDPASLRAVEDLRTHLRQPVKVFMATTADLENALLALKGERPELLEQTPPGRPAAAATPGSSPALAPASVPSGPPTTPPELVSLDEVIVEELPEPGEVQPAAAVPPPPPAEAMDDEPVPEAGAALITALPFGEPASSALSSPPAPPLGALRAGDSGKRVSANPASASIGSPEVSPPFAEVIIEAAAEPHNPAEAAPTVHSAPPTVASLAAPPAVASPAPPWAMASPPPPPAVASPAPPWAMASLAAPSAVASPPPPPAVASPAPSWAMASPSAPPAAVSPPSVASPPPLLAVASPPAPPAVAASLSVVDLFGDPLEEESQLSRGQSAASLTSATILGAAPPAIAPLPVATLSPGAGAPPPFASLVPFGSLAGVAAPVPPAIPPLAPAAQATAGPWAPVPPAIPPLPVPPPVARAPSKETASEARPSPDPGQGSLEGPLTVSPRTRAQAVDKRAVKFSDEEIKVLEGDDRDKVKPARMVATLIRLLIRKNVITELEFLDELSRK